MTRLRIVAGVVAVAVAGSGLTLYGRFGAFLPWRENEEVRRLARLAQVREGETIAEIGAGGGRFAFALAGIVGPTGRVFVTELAGPPLDVLSARAAASSNVRVIRAERDETLLPDACCDLILMRNMFHHAGLPDSFLAGVRRSVKPGGRVAIIDFEPGALWFHGGRPDGASERRPGHGVSQAAVSTEMIAAGFSVEHTEVHWSGPMWLSLFRRAR